MPVTKNGSPERVIQQVEAGAVKARFIVPTNAEFGIVEGVHEVWKSDDYRVLNRPNTLAGRVVVDIGANVGAFTVLAAKLGARVHAYEPHPDNFDLLARNCVLNQYADGDAVLLHELAVTGGHDGTVSLDGDGGGATVATVRGAVNVGSCKIGDVIFAAGTLGNPVALLKIDCEGAEYDIIGGMTGDHFACIDRIEMEFHGPEMPHLGDLHDGDMETHLLAFGAMVTKLAEFGHVEMMGHPRRGGLLHWRRY